MFNSGHYNGSVLISAIRVARARSRLWGYRPNRTSDLGNFKPALTPKDKPGDAFSAPPGLTASSKMGRTGEYAPPAVACSTIDANRQASAGPAQLSSKSIVMPFCL